MNIRSTRFLTQAAAIGAAYLVLTLPFAQFAFGGPFQFRLAEALTVLAALTPAAIPGLFIGCLLANLFNPQSLGPIDIVFGSLASLLSAWLTWRWHQRLREGQVVKNIRYGQYSVVDGGQGLAEKSAADQEKEEIADMKLHAHPWLKTILVISPSVWVNALVVGFYLPFLIPGQALSPVIVIGFMGSIFVSQAIMVYLIGLPLLKALRKAYSGKRLV